MGMTYSKSTTKLAFTAGCQPPQSSVPSLVAAISCFSTTGSTNKEVYRFEATESKGFNDKRSVVVAHNQFFHLWEPISNGRKETAYDRWILSPTSDTMTSPNLLKRQGGRHQEVDCGMFDETVKPTGRWTSFESYEENCINRSWKKLMTRLYCIFKPEVPWMCALAAFYASSMN